VRIVLLGPPGVGKGTQGRRISGDLGLPLISTGEILRDAVARQTPLGLEAKRQMDQGLYVADDVMVGLVRDRTLAADAERGFVLDGFPRTVRQAEALEGMLADRGQAVDAVVSFTAPPDELVRRLSARRECPICKRAYNLDSAAPRDGVHCDDHPDAVLATRADDAETTVRRRLEVYEEQTAPLTHHYERQGRLLEVSGVGTVNTVAEAVAKALQRVPQRGGAWSS
jgi:adenylate kinase